MSTEVTAPPLLFYSFFVVETSIDRELTGTEYVVDDLD